MRLSARMENKNTGFQIRAHGSLAERFGRYVYLNNACSNGSDSDNNRNNKNYIKNNCWCWMGARNDRGYGVIAMEQENRELVKLIALLMSCSILPNWKKIIVFVIFVIIQLVLIHSICL